MLNRDFVAVWINVRTTPLPRLPIIPDVLVNARERARDRLRR